jgi:hypothetical protein
VTTGPKAVRLSVEEADYLAKPTCEDKSFAALLSGYPEILVNGRAVTLSGPLAEMLRAYFAERLARVGFDTDYEPNTEGQLLERLIDTFFLPETRHS